jgi:hypothetical protein
MERGWRVLCFAALAAVALFAAPAASAADAITLAAGSATVPYGALVEFSGQATPATEGELVTVSVLAPAGPVPVGTAATGADGAFRLQVEALSPGPYVASAGLVQSETVSLTIRPRLRAALTGRGVLGGTLRLSGRVEPSVAGTLRLRLDGAERAVRTSADGTFAVSIPAARPGQLAVRLRIEPAPGFTDVSTAFRRRIAAPLLRPGSTGAAVLHLERRLAELGYVLRGIDARFREDTRDAVLAFRKVRGLPRIESVDRAVWRSLATATRPRARVPTGNHIEVDKGRQVLYEVRGGQVVRVMHVSTGATGNTPVGRWRVYWKDAGYNSIGMYYSLYFLRGFAIHGYHSVPTYPASHGCVRVPIWFAKSLYDRWRSGAVVYVFP